MILPLAPTIRDLDLDLALYEINHRVSEVWSGALQAAAAQVESPTLNVFNSLLHLQSEVVTSRHSLPSNPMRKEPIMASLCLLGDDGLAIQRWQLGEAPLSIGRDASADVKIEDQSLSRRHFLIRLEGDHFVIQDLASQNGTWVDGNRTQTANLRHHDCILAGRTLFLFSQHTVAGSQSVPARPICDPLETELAPAA